MKMAIYYEILRNLRSIRTASKHRNLIQTSKKVKKLPENYIEIEVYHTYYHSLRGYRYRFATLR